MRDARDRFSTTGLPFVRNVYGAALRMCGRPDVAEDTTQETYLRAYRTFDWARRSESRPIAAQKVGHLRA